MGLIIYIIIGVLWGLFATKRQQEVYPQSSTGKTIFTGIINGIGWPIAMIIAYNRS